MKNKKLLQILTTFSKITILEVDINGKVKNIVFDTNEELKIKKGINIKEIFTPEDRKRIEVLFSKGLGEESKYLKISTKYSKGKTYVNAKVIDIEGKTYVSFLISESQREKEIRYEERLENLLEKAEEDQLTGLLNRHGYWERVKRILNCGDPDRKIGILFIDMDGLKEINDSKGHKKGDIAINQIANLISKSVRRRDVAVRYGGDEFVIVVEELTGSKGTAHGLAKRILREINKEKGKYIATVSIGVHVVKVGKIFKEGLSNVALHRHWEHEVAIADKMAYKAKEAGKNTVVISK